MTREEREKHLDWLYRLKSEIFVFMPKDWLIPMADALDMAIKALELEPCGVCIDFKRYAKQMGFEIEKESIPYLMHKEMDIPISECQKHMMLL